jgi:hypothetical protein
MNRSPIGSSVEFEYESHSQKVNENANNSQKQLGFVAKTCAALGL